MKVKDLNNREISLIFYQFNRHFTEMNEQLDKNMIAEKVNIDMGENGPPITPIIIAVEKVDNDEVTSFWLDETDRVNDASISIDSLGEKANELIESCFKELWMYNDRDAWSESDQLSPQTFSVTNAAAGVHCAIPAAVTGSIRLILFCRQSKPRCGLRPDFSGTFYRRNTKRFGLLPAKLQGREADAVVSGLYP